MGRDKNNINQSYLGQKWIILLLKLPIQSKIVPRSRDKFDNYIKYDMMKKHGKDVGRYSWIKENRKLNPFSLFIFDQASQAAWTVIL
jgi:hypothetical protein